MGVSNRSTVTEVYWLPEPHQGICHWVPFSWAVGGVIILSNVALCLCHPLGIKSSWWLQCSESMDKITECRQTSIASQDSLAENTREAGKAYTERKWCCYVRILTFKWKINSRVAVGPETSRSSCAYQFLCILSWVSVRSCKTKQPEKHKPMSSWHKILIHVKARWFVSTFALFSFLFWSLEGAV